MANTHVTKQFVYAEMNSIKPYYPQQELNVPKRNQLTFHKEGKKVKHSP